ncbi:biotin--[acetyl-CoA-carboxylase] ligase [Terrabacter aerolatus]|uniref:biotin--[biotin carboxyl-carrier protein] ligase n=1 Tax=Terrabacter aerolatus TaxID=422442 RepID=A0A512D3D8_9MICO|nr:biotin--[acetyl-CoA-carboxylase] ligase [Terrabacter aerolatus]GEO30972.1 biotin--[acetyl-CoA-carboxylase] ligase [Terrabacter aerolatus]
MRDSLDIETVSAALVTSGRPWRGVEFHPAVGSTNTRLRELLTGSPPATSAYAVSPGDDVPGPWWVVLTDHQTGGRGRLGRAWTVPDRASLAVSVAVPVTDPAQAGWMPLLAGLALARAVTEVTEAAGHRLTSRLKWPNDVLLADDGDRKLSGILCELVASGGRQVVVVGTGVNVDQTRDELPVETATSLALAGVRVRREDLLVAYLDHLTAVLGGAGVTRADDTGAVGREAVRAAYRSACVTLGLQVRVQLPAGGAAEGTAVAVDDDGGLVVRTAGGLRTFAAGDVVHVRAAAGGLA